MGTTNLCPTLTSLALQVDFLMSGLMVLKERIDATEALIAIDLDNRRNELVAFDLVCSTLTFATFSLHAPSQAQSCCCLELYASRYC